MVWVIITCTLAFGCTVAALYFWTDWKDALAKRNALTEEATALEKAYQQEVDDITATLPYTGFKRGGEDPVPPTSASRGYLLERQKDLLPAYLAQKQLDRQLSLDTLQTCVVVAAKDLDAALKLRGAAEVEVGRGRAALETAKKREPEIQQSREKTVAEIQVDIQAKGADLQRLNAEFETKRQAEEEEARKANEEREGLEKKHKDEMIRIENQINELKRQLEEVKRREVIRYDVTEVHGEVYQVDTEGRRVFITIGSAQRVVKGLRFRLAVPGDYGRLQYKGEIEVKRVWPNHSEAAITAAYDAEHPIVRGDLLVNPLFDTRRPKVVAFAGEPASHQIKYTVNEATRRILEIGSAVRDQATIDLDFLITTDAYEGHRDFLKAIELQIPVAAAQEVLHFLGD